MKLILPEEKTPEVEDSGPCECRTCKGGSLKGSLVLEDCKRKPTETVGEAAMRLMDKGDEKQAVLDTAQEMNKGYIDSLINAAKRGESLYGRSAPFYVCVISKKERLLPNVVRRYFYPRQSRPIPDYDLALYHYDPRDEKLSFVWVLPDKEKFWSYFIADKSGYIPMVPEDERDLYRFCSWALKGELV